MYGTQVNWFALYIGKKPENLRAEPPPGILKPMKAKFLDRPSFVFLGYKYTTTTMPTLHDSLLLQTS